MADHIVEVVDERELKGVLDFAEHVIMSPSRAWQEFNLDQKQRFQNIVFPGGVVLHRTEGFGTPSTSTIFRYLEVFAGQKPELVAHTGIEPVFRP